MIPGADFHIHTRFCGHAAGTAQELASAAAQKGLSRIGISDHVPFPDGRWPEVRMKMTDLPQYIAEVREAQKSMVNIKVLLGMECDYYPLYSSYFKDALRGNLGFDYLAGAIHYIEPKAGEIQSVFKKIAGLHGLLSYTDLCVEAIESGLFDFIAHPDIFNLFYRRWNSNTERCAEKICTAAAAKNIPLEINTSGWRKPKILTTRGMRPMYPVPEFWEIAASCGAKAIINSDAHRPADIGSLFDRGADFASEMKVHLADKF